MRKHKISKIYRIFLDYKLESFKNQKVSKNNKIKINFLTSKGTKRIISFSKKNGLYLKDFKFKQDDILLFGREDSGLPDTIIDKSDFLISIFMPNLQTGNNDQKGVRSLNLSVACGIAIYEAHKQINIQNGN